MLTHARPFLAPVALAAAATLALTPAVVAPIELPAPRVVQAADVALTGIGQDIYFAITPVVQEAVGGVSYLVNFVPLIGGPIAAQININYFQAVQPVIEATVNYLAATVQNPLNFISNTTAYGGTLYDIGYNWVSAEAVFFGLPPLPPLPQTAAAVSASATASKSVRPARTGGQVRQQPRAAAAVQRDTGQDEARPDARASAAKARSGRR